MAGFVSRKKKQFLHDIHSLSFAIPAFHHVDRVDRVDRVDHGDTAALYHDVNKVCAAALLLCP
mgnify:CR=1 FL=1